VYGRAETPFSALLASHSSTRDSAMDASGSKPWTCECAVTHIVREYGAASAARSGRHRSTDGTTPRARAYPRRCEGRRSTFAHFFMFLGDMACGGFRTCRHEEIGQFTDAALLKAYQALQVSLRLVNISVLVRAGARRFRPVGDEEMLLAFARFRRARPLFAATRRGASTPRLACATNQTPEIRVCWHA
jgi:hypothetical protein